MSVTDSSGASGTAGSAGPDSAPLHRILVPTDFSATAERAIDYALALAKKLGASVHLCHCAPEADYEVAGLVSPGMRTAAASFIQQAMELTNSAHAELETVAARKRDLGVPLTTSMLKGEEPAEAIAVAALDLGSDLIVIGSRSRSGVRHLLLGSVAEKVMRSAHCPVLVVHPDDRSEE